jgi:hypothetical protein
VAANGNALGDYLRARRGQVRDLHVDWEESTDVLVSGLREAAAGDPDDPRHYASTFPG